MKMQMFNLLLSFGLNDLKKTASQSVIKYLAIIFLSMFEKRTDNTASTYFKVLQSGHKV